MHYRLNIVLSGLFAAAFGVLSFLTGSVLAWIAFGIWVVALVSQVAYLFLVVKKE